MGIALDVLSFGASQDQANSIEREARVTNAQQDAALAGREADRKEQLAISVASSRSNAAASGIAFEGSPLAEVNENVRRSGIDSDRDRFSTRVNKLANTYRAKSQSSVLRQQASISLLQSAENRAQSAVIGGA